MLEVSYRINGVTVFDIESVEPRRFSGRPRRQGALQLCVRHRFSEEGQLRDARRRPEAVRDETRGRRESVLRRGRRPVRSAGRQRTAAQIGAPGLSSRRHAGPSVACWLPATLTSMTNRMVRTFRLCVVALSRFARGWQACRSHCRHGRPLEGRDGAEESRVRDEGRSGAVAPRLSGAVFRRARDLRHQRQSKKLTPV